MMSASGPLLLWKRRKSRHPITSHSVQNRTSTAHHLLAVGLRDLSDELRPGHVDGAVDGPSLRPRIVLEDFHHQCGVVGEDHAGLQHPQKTDLSFGFAESTG